MEHNQNNPIAYKHNRNIYQYICQLNKIQAKTLPLSRLPPTQLRSQGNSALTLYHLTCGSGQQPHPKSRICYAKPCANAEYKDGPCLQNSQPK